MSLLKKRMRLCMKHSQKRTFMEFDEMRLVEKQMERIPETIGSIPYIIIMDRDYPSTPAFIHMMDKDIKFIVRLK